MQCHKGYYDRTIPQPVDATLMSIDSKAEEM